MKTSAITLVVLLAGCAAQPQQWRWYKAGADQAQYEMDHGQCTAQAFSVASGNLMQIAIVQNSCLRGKGWQRVPA